MKKSDLKLGMVVEYHDGRRRLVYLNDRLMGKDGHTTLDGYYEDLTYDFPELIIDKVYKSTAYVMDDMFKDKYLTLLWERKEPFKMIPGNYYVIRNWIFKYEGLKKDFPETEGSDNAIIYSMLSSTDSEYTHLGISCGIGCVTDYNNQYIRKATKEEVIKLYKDCLENGRDYAINDGDYNYIITYSNIGSDGIIRYKNCYDCESQTIDNLPGSGVCEVSEVASIREATEEESKLLKPTIEFTVEQLEKKLGMNPGTLRIKK